MMRKIIRCAMAAAMASVGLTAAGQITMEFADASYNAAELEMIQLPIQMKVTPADAQYTGAISTEEDSELDAVGKIEFTGIDSATATYQVYFTQGSEEGVWNLNAYLMGIREKTPGTYVLTVNAGAFKEGDNLSPEFTHTWTIAEQGAVTPGDENIEPQAVMPYDEVQDAPFVSIMIAFPYDQGTLVYDGSENPLTVKNAQDEAMPIEVSVNGNILKVAMNLTVNGEYTLNVPAGVIRNDKGKNLEITRTYTVVNGEDPVIPVEEDIEPQAVMPYDEEQEAPFTSIRIAFAAEDGDVTCDEGETPITVVRDADNAAMPIEVSAEANIVKVEMNLTEAGEYTLTVPAGVISNSKGKNVEITRRYTVVVKPDSGINHVESSSEKERYYNLNGVEVSPERGEILIRVSQGKTTLFIP